ncbi:MAG: hypothetical protein JWQ10_887 [Herbaspirillum sp.]|nr:hypothetical protein [Herbaspirillum sp.]
MSNEEKLDYLIGQVTVLKAFCIASIVAHPDPSKLAKHFDRAKEITIAKTLSTNASEETLAGIENISADLSKVCSLEAKR